MKETILSFWRPNMGYRMLHCLLLKVFPRINIKRTYRLWKELHLGRVKRYWKKRTGTLVPYAATMPSDVWTMDIVHDSCMYETKLRIFSIIGAFTMECLALDVSTRISANTVRTFHGRLFTLGQSHDNYEVIMNVRLLPDTQLGYQAPADVAAMKAGSLMVPLGYQTGADHIVQEETWSVVPLWDYFLRRKARLISPPRIKRPTLVGSGTGTPVRGLGRVSPSAQSQG